MMRGNLRRKGFIWLSYPKTHREKSIQEFNLGRNLEAGAVAVHGGVSRAYGLLLMTYSE